MSKSKKYMEAMRAYDDEQLPLALRLMERAAQEGDVAACFTTALWYRDGEGASANLEMSAKYLARYEELAEQGDGDAQWDVGQNYRFGNLLPLNIAKANYWLERAANSGNGEAAHHLAWYYETGQYGYPMDATESAKWYKLAFERGNPETLYLFAIRLFQNGKPTEEAIALLAQAAAKGFTQAEDVLRSQLH